MTDDINDDIVKTIDFLGFILLMVPFLRKFLAVIHLKVAFKSLAPGKVLI